MIRRTKLALETKPETTLKGVLWYQGESDGNPQVVKLYHERMHELIASVRSDLGVADLPFYVTQLGPFATPFPQPLGNVETWNTIREVQRTLPNEIANVAVAPAIDLDLDDGIHIGTLGLKRLGKRFANIALREVYGQATPTPITLASVKLEGRTVKVTFDGVNGSLVTPDPGGRVFGFGMSTHNAPYDTNTFHKGNVTGPNEISLYLNIDIEPSFKLWYGYGWHPVCQLADTADMGVPAFGPVEIAW
jgi:sialate O-acetylesterase